MNDYAIRNRKIKQAITRFDRGFVKVGVIGHRGTATGWVEINADILRPDNCEMTETTREDWHYCKICRNAKDEAETRIRHLARTTAKEIGIPLGHYYADDGYDTEREELLVNIHFANQLN